ncbi:hypothetical protein ACIBQX_28695 [Nonomuraea sp. NPDC049714]|uniref:hypothetical protein n=1 Tax=Nonomuraea sp. NPDC049714 TaxID=3364357 RepID=UPI0037B15451
MLNRDSPAIGGPRDNRVTPHRKALKSGRKREKPRLHTMSTQRKYTRTKKTLSRVLALGALVYLVITFATQGAESAGQVSSVIAAISLLLTSLGLVRFGSETPARKSARKALARKAAHAPFLPAPIGKEEKSRHSDNVIIPLGWLMIDGCGEMPTMTGWQAIKDLCTCVPDGLPLTLFALPTGNPHGPGWVTPGRLVVICGIGMVCPA